MGKSSHINRSNRKNLKRSRNKIRGGSTLRSQPVSRKGSPPPPGASKPPNQDDPEGLP